MDSFYKPLSAEERQNVVNYNFDHPDAFEIDLLINTIKQLKEGKSVEIPIYDFKTHSRVEGEAKHVYGADCIIVEGIYVLLDEALRDLFDLRLFVDTADDIRLARRLKRDIVERGRDINGVLDQYEKFVKPAFDDYISPTKQHADVIIPRGADNEVAINLVASHLRTTLMERGWNPPISSTQLLETLPENVHVLNSNSQVRHMSTILRDAATSRDDFIFYSDRLARLLVEDALNWLPTSKKVVTTPTGDQYHGLAFPDQIAALTIMRAGDTLIPAVRSVLKDISIGAVLISKEALVPKLFFYKLPSEFKEHFVLLLDPVCGTGLTVTMAIRLLLDHGIEEERILYICVIASVQGLTAIMKQYPKVHIVVGMVDNTLTADGIILPGLGVYGDRYFGTEPYDDNLVEMPQ
eukprot:TRINITY_DN15499_c0_g1_i1.p1 TRINITY_DN15499_c0_g1~~TRINITY_DN15499_c0_g1_i1.p1  ORF type:complete len:480 (+),score=118.79 TRINITY_DN15499_c0_g1_i1:217-1440(+)